jgi:hypothetical protein
LTCVLDSSLRKFAKSHYILSLSHCICFSIAALATQQLTDKPIVEYFAAQRLQALWHQAHARRNWQEMLQKLREMKEKDDKINSRRGMFASFRGRSRKSSSKTENNTYPKMLSQTQSMDQMSASDFGFEPVGAPHASPSSVSLSKKMKEVEVKDDDDNETKESVHPDGTTL